MTGDDHESASAAADPDPASVFVSYASADEHAARRLCARLEEASTPFWFAPRHVDGGADWAERIAAGIASSRVLVLLFSRAANRSEHVRREIHLAAEHGLRVIPVRLEDVKPEGSLAYFLAGIHWIDAFRRDRPVDLDRAVRQALAANGGTLLPAPRETWRVVTERLAVLALVVASAALLRGPHGGRPLVPAGWATALGVIGALYGAALYLGARQWFSSRPARPVLAMIALYTVGICAFAGGVRFRALTTRTFTPDAAQVRNLFGMDPGTPIPEAVLEDPPCPLVLEAAAGGGYRAVALVPPVGWLSPGTRAYLEGKARSGTDTPRDAIGWAIRREPFWFLDQELDREGDRDAKLRVTLVAVLLYLSALGALSLAHAALLTLLERVGARGSVASEAPRRASPAAPSRAEPAVDMEPVDRMRGDEPPPRPA